MKCLYELTVPQLNHLVKDVLDIEHWQIKRDKLNNRKDAILTSHRFKVLKEHASTLNYLFDDMEIVTWFDTLMTMFYTFSYIEDDDILDKIKILQECSMPYSNKRADYILTYDNKILIIEFSFNKLNNEFNYETKFQQAVNYKEQLCNILPKEIEIGTYTFLLEAEIEENWSPIYSKDGKTDANFYKRLDLANYIINFFRKNIDLAINSIHNIKD